MGGLDMDDPRLQAPPPSPWQRWWGVLFGMLGGLIFGMVYIPDHWDVTWAEWARGSLLAGGFGAVVGLILSWLRNGQGGPRD